MVGLLSLESCCVRPKMRNSVLEGLRNSNLQYERDGVGLVYDDKRIGWLSVIVSVQIVTLSVDNRYR